MGLTKKWVREPSPDPLEFQRLKEEEQKLLGWTAKRELSKINYRIHTDAIKSHLVPAEITAAQASIIYAEEADASAGRK